MLFEIHSFFSRCNLETDDFKAQACRPKHFQLAWRWQDVYCYCVCMIFTLKNLGTVYLFAGGLSH